MDYETITIQKENLSNFEMPISIKPFILSILSNDIKFDFLIKFLKQADDVLIMGSGSYDVNKMSPPIFQRHGWIEEFKETVIIYNDPTLYIGKISLGWGNGTKDRHFLHEISEFLRILLEKMYYKFENTFLYGSSAGGYMAMVLAGYLKGATAIVNNPQTIVGNFWPKPVQSMIEASYPGMTLSEVNEKYPERMNVIEFFKSINYIPKIHYLQNITASRDVEKHLMPFISGLNKLSQQKATEKINIKLYSDKKKDIILFQKKKRFYL